MKKCLVLACLLLLGCGGERRPEPVRGLDFEAAETYVQLCPADGFLHIREYCFSTLKSDSGEIQRQVDELSELVRTAQYCKTRYGLSAFTSMEERMFHDRDFITVECKLLTREQNLRTIMKNAYSSVLKQSVEATISEGEIGLHFDGRDIEVRTNNALGVYAKDKRKVIFWRNGERCYEAVFARAGSKEADFHSIAEFVKDDVASPEKSEAEIKDWKAGR